MTRTVIDVDDESLKAAALVLGTSTKVATVNRALAEVAAREARLAFLDDLDDAALPPPPRGDDGSSHTKQSITCVTGRP
ncbi:MAG: type II toxin-antitoxin system VapB family antitoxin [Acidimicrobiia bacterium]